MQNYERQERLLKIAQQDEIYQAYRQSYDECNQNFSRFVKWCPKKVRNYLCGYAESGRLMMQRMVNLACEHMEFPENET